MFPLPCTHVHTHVSTVVSNHIFSNTKSQTERNGSKSRSRFSSSSCFQIPRIKWKPNVFSTCLFIGMAYPFVFLRVLSKHLMIWVEGLEMCAFTFAGAFSNTQRKKKKTKSTHWCEGDAAALHARHFRVRQTVISTNRRREVATAEFFDLRLLQSRHQSSAAFGGGDARFLGTLSTNQAKNSGQKKISSNNSTTGKTGHTRTIQ